MNALNTLDSIDAELWEPFYWNGDGARSCAGWYYCAGNPLDYFSDDELVGPFHTEAAAKQHAYEHEEDALETEDY